MRENINISFSIYEWKPIEKKMKLLGMNRYEFGRFCLMKESGVEFDRTTEKDEKSIIRNGNSGLETIVDDLE